MDIIWKVLQQDMDFLFEDYKYSQKIGRWLNFFDTQQHLETKSAHQKPDAINMNEMCDKWMYQGHCIAN